MNPGQLPHFDFKFTSMHELVKPHQEQLRVKLTPARRSIDN